MTQHNDSERVEETIRELLSSFYDDYSMCISAEETEDTLEHYSSKVKTTTHNQAIKEALAELPEEMEATRSIEGAIAQGHNTAIRLMRERLSAKLSE